MVTVKLPDIGEGVAEGEIIEWLKKVGESVKQDEPVVVVMTDKATVELPAPEEGVITRHFYKPGDIAKVGAPLYEIGGTNKAETLALPKTRKMAKDFGIDLQAVTPSGKHGEVTEFDLHGLSGGEERPLIGIRKLMAVKMSESKANIPHFSYFEQVDATRLVQLRDNVKKAAFNEGINATYMPFIIRALSLTIDKFPELNSSIDMKKSVLRLHKNQNVGIAITTPHGLIVPVLANVQDMLLQDIIRAYDSLKKRALKNELDSKEMRGSTITVSNYGVLGGGGRWATPVINYPEVAILAIARIQKMPMVKGSELVVRDALNLSWSFDHRVIDGAIAAEASNYFSTLLDNPAPLL